MIPLTSYVPTALPARSRASVPVSILLHKEHLRHAPWQLVYQLLHGSGRTWKVGQAPNLGL